MHKQQDKYFHDMISDIKDGNCVAFIGAGFTAPAIHTWSEVLEKLKGAPGLKTVNEQLSSLLKLTNGEAASLFDREAAAEIIKHKLGDDFIAEIKKALPRNNPEGEEIVTRRLENLDRIPFESRITTNFDGKIAGKTLNEADFSSVLRLAPGGWADRMSWDLGKPKKIKTIMLHGNVTDIPENKETIVFSRSGYRKLLFETPNYQSLIRTVFATKTVVFLGFSFSDAYLNLIRSEVISMLTKGSAKNITSYAIMNDLSPDKVNYLRDHEGIKAISYKSKKDGTDHSGFDDILEGISNATNPEKIASRLLHGHKILWYDPQPELVDVGVEILRKYAAKGDDIVQESDLNKAINRLETTNIDLFITHWGHNKFEHDGELEPAARMIARHVRKNEIEVPILIFSDGEFAKENRRTALRFGAFDYVYTYEDLFRRIEDVFGPAVL